jgi:hypothetical protein
VFAARTRSGLHSHHTVLHHLKFTIASCSKSYSNVSHQNVPMTIPPPMAQFGTPPERRLL